MRWMKFAGICGIILLSISFIYFVLTSISYFETISKVSVLNSLTGGDFPDTEFPAFSPGEGGGRILDWVIFIVMAFSGLFFYFGFTRLGHKTKNKLLTVSSWLLFGILAIFILFVILGSFFSWFSSNSSSEISLELFSSLTKFALYFFITLVGAFIFSSVLFFISLIQIRGEVKFSFPSGILGLIAVFIQLGIIGFFLYFIGLLRSSDLLGALGTLVNTLLFIFSVTGYLIFFLITLLHWVVYLFLTFSLFDGSKKYEIEGSDFL